MSRITGRPGSALTLACVALSFTFAGCAEEDGETTDDAYSCGEAHALSPCLTPRLEPQHYVDEGLRYFDSFDTDADPESRPTYAEDVARWEWLPWLLLTGFGSDWIEDGDSLVMIATPSTVPVRDCRFFDTQPFTRCRVSFQYEGGPCPIYEEFTFNDAGEITFIEAWSDQPDLLPMSDPDDEWGEGGGVNRLSTRVPGLGTPSGQIVDARSEAMTAAAADDPVLADFADRLARFPNSWFDEFTGRGDQTEEEIYGPGCGW